MALILSIETAVLGCSVALHRNGKLVSFIQLQNEKIASSLLTSAIENSLRFSQIDFEDIEAIAVSTGPGSYTGLRIGVSTAKGLCFALNVPLISINTLEIIVNSVQLPKDVFDFYFATLDARRMEVYCQLFESNMKCAISEIKSEVVDSQSFVSEISKGKLLFLGTGTQKIKKLYSDYSTCFFLDEDILPSANVMGEIAFVKYNNKDFENLAAFEPNYLKPYFATTPKNKLRP